MMPLPLEGVRVFDMSQGVAGPSCTLLMAAHGAEVIKLEPPDGDWIRRGAQQVRGVSPAALSFNLGKRSLALDLKKPAAQAVARQIAEQCDVVVESFRPGVVERFGLDAASLRASRPQMVYCSINGFGREGGYRTRPAIDHIAQAYSGWMHLNANAQGVPQRTRNVVLADQITGLYAWQAIAAALLRRFRFGTGAALEVTLVGAMAAFLAPRLVSQALSDGSVGSADFTVPTGDYATADGLLVLAVQKPSDVERLCAAIGHPEWLHDERFATPQGRRRFGAQMREALSAVLLSRSALQWEALLVAHDVMACAVRDLPAFMSDQAEQGLALVETATIGALGPVPLARLPGTVSWAEQGRPPSLPRVGEHGPEILREFGHSAADIEHYLREGVLTQAPPPASAPTPSQSLNPLTANPLTANP